MRSLFLLINLTIVCSLFAANGTDQKKDPLTSGTLQEQFDGMLEKSNRYQDFKVVKRTMLDRFIKNINDTLQANIALTHAQAKAVNDLEMQIKGFELKLHDAHASINGLENEKESITFFGSSMSKAGYKFTMWTIVTLLFFSALFFAIKFKNSHVITSHAKDSLARMEEEFDSFRKFARDREELISRELQDEINKRAAS